MFSQIRGDSVTPEWWSRSKSKLCTILADEQREMFYSAPHAVSYIYIKWISVHFKMLSIRGYCNCNTGPCTLPFKNREPQEGSVCPWHYPAVKLLVQVTQKGWKPQNPASTLPQRRPFPSVHRQKASEITWPDENTTSTLFSVLYYGNYPIAQLENFFFLNLLLLESLGFVSTSLFSSFA